MEKIVALLGCDCIVLVAGYYDIYRKPAIGSFRYLQSLFSSPIEAASFFCGDTYGTCCGPSSPLGKKPKKLTDILFAKNCGVPFYTPSDFFSSSSLLPASPYPFTAPAFDPSSLRNASKTDLRALLRPKDSLPEVVLLIGPPASGKSRLCEDIFADYERVSQDLLKTLSKCQRKAQSALKMKKSVVVDNTNPTVNVALWAAREA